MCRSINSKFRKLSHGSSLTDFINNNKVDEEW